MGRGRLKTDFCVFMCVGAYYSGVGTGGARGAGAPQTFWHSTTPTTACARGRIQLRTVVRCSERSPVSS